MKTRACTAILLASLLAPTLAPHMLGSALPWDATEARADDAVTEVARQRYAEGVKAFDSGRYEEARTAFLQAYALKRHPAVLLNLGQSELRSGHPVEAGNHLQQFLREHKDATPAQKTAAKSAIEDAKRRAPHVIVIVDSDGADVSLDGTSLGKSPIIDPVFVSKGQHTFVATLADRSTTTSVDAKVGPATAVNLTLGAGTAPVAPVPAAPPPAQPGYPPPGQQPGFTFGGPTGPQPDRAQGEREPFFDWYARKPIAWIGTAITGLGLGTGVIFSIAASSASSAADQHSSEIRAEADKDGIDQPCGSEDGGGDLPKYVNACNTLRDDLSDYDTDVAIATVGWIAFGVGLVGTVTYAMIDWFPKKKRPNADVEAGSFDMAIAPVVTPTQKGVGIIGSF